MKQKYPDVKVIDMDINNLNNDINVYLESINNIDKLKTIPNLYLRVEDKVFETKREKV